MERSRALAREQAGNAHHQRMSQLAADYNLDTEKAATDHRDRLAAIEAEYDAASEKAEKDHGDRLASIVAEWSADMAGIVAAELNRLDAAVATVEASTSTKPDVLGLIDDYLFADDAASTKPDVLGLIDDYLFADDAASTKPDVLGLIDDYLFADDAASTKPDVLGLIDDYLFADDAAAAIDLSSLFTMPDFGPAMDAAQGHDIEDMAGAGKGGDTYIIHGDVLDRRGLLQPDQRGAVVADPAGRIR